MRYLLNTCVDIHYIVTNTNLGLAREELGKSLRGIKRGKTNYPRGVEHVDLERE